MSSIQELPTSALTAASGSGLQWALARIAARAGELDREPRFPAENFADLAVVGALSPSPSGLAGEDRLASEAGLARDVRLVRALAAADASAARILDGHLNGIERLELSAPEPLRSTELARIRAGELLLGVWGADPAAGEGLPARLHEADGQLVLCGVKTFCSGAGGVQRALVIATDRDGDRRLVYLDPTTQISVDRDWYRASGLRSSESHRVEFHDTPVLALLGGPGELSREPYFSRDSIRTSATWAGLADCIVQQTAAMLDRERLNEVQAHSLGRMRIAHATIDRWLEHTMSRLDDPGDPGDPAHPAHPVHPDHDPLEPPGRAVLTDLAVECRVALTACARLIGALAAEVCGSRALVDGSPLDRARRDLDLFLLQHRLDTKIAGLGSDMLLEERR